MQIGISIFAILSSIGCATPQTEYRYITIKPKEITIPDISEYADKTELDKPLDLVSQPDTVSDVLHNMSEYRNAYVLWRTYSISLEEYISTVAEVIDAYNKGNAE